MFKSFSRKKEKAAITKSSTKAEPEFLVNFNYNDDYVDIVFNEKFADNATGEYIYDHYLRLEKIYNPNKSSSEFIKYSIIEFSHDSLDYISKGDTIFIIRRNEDVFIKEFENNVLALPPVVCPQNGIIEIFIQERQPIHDNDIICRIHLNSSIDNANSPKNEMYQVKYNKYEIPKTVRDLNLTLGKCVYISKWLVNDGDFVEKGKKIIELKGGNKDEIFFTYELKSKTAGVICLKESPKLLSIQLKQKDFLYLIYKNEDIRFKSLFSNEIDIQHDDFTNTKTIKWNVVGGLKYPFNSYTPNPIGGIISDSQNGFSLIFSFQNHSSKDYIVFDFFVKEYKLMIEDQIDFLFDDNELISFKITEKSHKVISNWKQLFETKVPITLNELNSFKTKKLLKWRIELKSSYQVINGLANNSWYKNENFHRVLQNLVSEYLEAVNLHIENYSPLLNKLESECETLKTNEKCHVYLMIDTTNNFHKIGISNFPEYREKTLQSDKPTIELICSKKFPSRKIAESIEKALHTTFAEKRLRGEWFELNDNEIDEIIETLK